MSIVVRDEGKEFDFTRVPDPTGPENIGSVHGRGIYVMKALMDEVRFEDGGTVIHMRKSADGAPALLTKDAAETPSVGL